MIKIGLVGLGTVNSGVYEIINSRKTFFSKLTNKDVSIAKILVKDKNKQRDIEYDTSLVTTDVEEFINSDLDIVVEAITNTDLAYYIISNSIKKGRHIVTASKAVVSKYYEELFALGKEHNVKVFVEASVAGGVPVIKPLLQAKASNNLQEIKAILNGTTNFILSKMYNDKFSFDKALDLAQELGFAEADPTDDIEGFDALRKLVILSNLAYSTSLKESEIPCRGITEITADDIEYFKELGLIVKLIGSSVIVDNKVSASVEPILFDETSIFNTVNMSNNIVSVVGDNVGELKFYGRGAGKLPTANSIVSDIVDVLTDQASINPNIDHEVSYVKDHIFKGAYYVRFNTNKNFDTVLKVFDQYNLTYKIFNQTSSLVLIIK